jgi:hypothetical protein
LSDKKTTNKSDSKKGLKALFHYWHPPLCSCQLPVNIHTWWHVVREKKGRPTINIKRPRQYAFITHSQLMKIIKRIYYWRSTLYNKKGTLGSVSPCQFRYLTRKSPTGNTNTGTSFHLRVNMQMQLEYMEYPQYWNLNHLFN